MREVLSYSRRGARFTPRQAAAWEAHHQDWVIPDEALDDPEFAWTAWFGREAPLIVEIGSGVGEATAALAAARPDHNVLGFEVWRPGAADTFARSPRSAPTTCGSAGSTRSGRWSTASRPARLRELWTFFPDPWHKKKHHKRRLVAPAVRVARREPVGARRACGGWPPTGPTTPSRWSRCWTPRSPWPAGVVDRWEERPVTRFERKGVAAGRSITDLCYRRAD